MLNVEKTMIQILISLALSIVATIAHAQTWTQLQWGVNKSSGYPYSVCMNISGSWSCIGSVNSGGVFSSSSSSMPAFTGGDCTSTAGSVALSCTKTGGVSFRYFATGTDAANLTGTVPAARLPAFTGGDCTSSAGSVALDCKSTFTPAVANNAALSALAYSYAPSVIRLGYAAAGDAPAVLYTRNNSTCSLNAGAGDGGSQVPTADGKCWVASFNGVASVAQYGAMGDIVGPTDDMARIQNALNAMSAAGGGVVNLDPAKSYYASSTITTPNKVVLRCDGPGVDVYQAPLNYTAKTCAIYSAVTGTTPALINNGGSDGVIWLQDRVRTVGNPNTRALMASLVGGFTGIGIQTGDGTNPGPANNTLVRNAIVGGFSTCLNVTYSSQDRWDTIYGDCTNGFSITDSHDDTLIKHYHAWNFLTTNRPHAADQWAISAIADNGSGGIRVTTSTTNDLTTGEYLFVYYSSGERPGAQNAFDRWQITVIDSTHFDLVGAVWAPTPTADTTNGSDYLAVSSTAGLARGQTISGTGIPGGATITAVWYGKNRISISSPATATNTGVSLTIANTAYTSGAIAYANYNYRSGTAMAINSSEGVQCLDCFTYSYETGLLLNNSTNVGISQFQSDSVIATPNGAAIKFTGASYGNTIVSQEINSGGSSIVSDTSGIAANLANTIIGATYKAFSNLIQNTGGGLIVVGASVRDNSAPILYTNSLSPALIGVNAPNSLIFSNTYPATTYRADGTTKLASAAAKPTPIFGGMTLNAALPTLAWKGTAQSADKKNWDTYLDASGNLNFRALNDAYGAASTWMQFTRGAGYGLNTINIYAALAVASVSGDGSGLTGLTRSQITDFGTGVSTALGSALNGSSGLVGYSGALGTPTSGTLTNATGLPVSTGIAGLGSGVATALGNATNGSSGVMVNGGSFNTGVQISGSAPTCSGTSAGTGATCAMGGGSNSTHGTIAITAGTTAGSSGTAVLTFASTVLGTTVPTCIAGYDNTGTAWNAAAPQPRVSAVSKTAITFTWDNNAVALTNGSQYRIMYICLDK